MSDPMDEARWYEERQQEYADRPPDPTAPRDIACICEGKYTVRLVLTQTLKGSGVWEGACVVCGRRYSHQEPLSLAVSV